MGEVKHVSIDTPIDEILNILEEDAGLIIDNFLSSESIDLIKDDLRPYLNVTRKGQDEFTGFETKRVGALMARSKTCQDLALNPLINQMVDNFLKPHCESYQLHFTSAIQIEPGESSQILHRDRGLWGGYIPRRIETHLVLSGQSMTSPKRMVRHKLSLDRINGIRIDNLYLKKLLMLK